MSQNSAGFHTGTPHCFCLPLIVDLHKSILSGLQSSRMRMFQQGEPLCRLFEMVTKIHFRFNRRGGRGQAANAESSSIAPMTGLAVCVASNRARHRRKMSSMGGLEQINCRSASHITSPALWRGLFFIYAIFHATMRLL